MTGLLRRPHDFRLLRYASVSTKAHLLCGTSHQPLPQQVVEVNEDETSVCVRDAERPNKSIECAFDKVFGCSSSQDDIFRGLVPALDTVVKGFNACVLAYGQTGSGKTHTLIGPGGGTRLADDQTEWGIIPRAVQFLFDRLNLESEEDETFSYSVTCSFLQIYNENLVDLLLHSGGAAGAAPLQIREEAGGGDRGGRGGGGGHRNSVSSGGRRPWSNESSRGGEDETGGMNGEDVLFGAGYGKKNRASPVPKGGKANVFVNGLSSFRVGGAQDVLHYVNLGAANRRVRATQHNEASSRSHAVMQLTVEVKSGGRGGEEGGGGASDHITYRQAKLSLVDLAGSEKMDSALSISKGHFKELRSINQSLSTLGNVVSALSEKGRTHVPYRDSKLTRLLQDSLGGNTRTTIIACINPLAGQTHETINTLQFADRAKKVMVRLRANEVVDDRVLLARARAEIKRLKKRLREALEGTLLGTAAEDDNNDGHCPNESSRSCHNHDRNGTPEETKPCPETVDDVSPGGAGDGSARGVKEEGDKGHSMTTSAVSNNAAARRRSASPSKAAAAVPSTALRLPKFRKRQFAVDGGRGQDSGGEGEPVEDALTAEEVRVIVSNSAEAEGASGSPEQKEEEEEEEQDAEEAKQLAMFRREIQEGVVSGSLVKRGGGGGIGRGTATVPVKSGAAAGVDGDGDNDGDNVNGNPDEQADIEVFIDQSQRLEDLMFEAQGRERRRLRGTIEPRVGRFPPTPSPRTNANGGQPADAKMKVQQLQDQHEDRRGQQRRSPPCYDGALAAPDTCSLMATVAQPVLRALVSKEKGISINVGDDNGPVRTGWADQSSRTTRETHSITNVDPTPTPTPATTATTTAMMMAAVLASPETTTDGCEINDPHRRASSTNNSGINDNSAVEAFAGERVQRVVPAINPPLERRRRQRQTGTRNQSPIPSSPSSLHGHPFPSPSVQRRRPATSTGGPPTGRNRARSNSRRIYRRKVGGSRSPVRGKPSAFLEPASPQVGPHDGGGEEHGPRRRQQGKVGSGGGGSGGGSSATKVVAATHPRLARSSPEQKQRSGQEFLGADADDQRKKGLSYSVADLGLRLKVYSFRYDHYYECQVVGYDSRRRMHRCAYDATGEKQWHDLASKRFEVVGQNGVIVRSTESAPPAPASFATTATNATPSLPLPTSPSNIVGAITRESGGGHGAPGRKDMIKMYQ
ncbi:conserved unknown protein [Ectocarpus siliculosus]|uniref:Kinesin motor domain-containing protein n=1 Tax=Ectocarpus siliculosus TaxID=2880 RepID=D7FZF0_ECTSI|nr:conserved unknown protein [Ectocarpus siliculosus]|eukprot:CBJ32767.1 conserved unknown protein [Ectocarpus siliculosus]